jgi:predicted nucleic acid-binding protein
MTKTEVLPDTSAWIAVTRGSAPARKIMHDAVFNGFVWTCWPVRFELMRGARSTEHIRELRDLLDSTPRCPLRDSAWRRAEEVLALLWERRGGRHRGLPMPDLLIAAVAEERGLPVLHDDAHFDLIGEVTGQPMVRLP